MPQLYDVARIGRDAELRYTTGDNSQAVINMALACDYGRKVDGKRPTQWLDATLWGKRAEALAPYLLKGQQVLVTVDDVHVEEYQSQGATRSKLVGRISNIKLVGSAPQAANQNHAARQPVPRQPAPQPNKQQAQPAQDFDDDIPF